MKTNKFFKPLLVVTIFLILVGFVLPVAAQAAECVVTTFGPFDVLVAKTKVEFCVTNILGETDVPFRVALYPAFDLEIDRPVGFWDITLPPGKGKCFITRLPKTVEGKKRVKVVYLIGTQIESRDQFPAFTARVGNQKNEEVEFYYNKIAFSYAGVGGPSGPV